MAQATFTINKESLEVRIVREYDATPERLWRAHTDPEQIAKWWGYNAMVSEMDVRVGGRWRFVDGDSKESATGFRGEYIEIDEPHTLVRTFEYEPFAGHVLVETANFEPLDGGKRTKLTIVSRYANLDDLEGMVATGMEQGSTASLERLAKLVEENK